MQKIRGERFRVLSSGHIFTEIQKDNNHEEMIFCQKNYIYYYQEHILNYIVKFINIWFEIILFNLELYLYKLYK